MQCCHGYTASICSGSLLTFFFYVCEWVIVVYRTAINSDSGVKTPAGGIFTGKSLNSCSLPGYVDYELLHNSNVALIKIGEGNYMYIQDNETYNAIHLNLTITVNPGLAKVAVVMR